MNSQSDRPDIRYLTVSDLYNINFTVMEGDTFVRDVNLLRSAAKRPAIVLFGQEQFPTMIDKAAALMHSLAYHHLFVDGNKRTAVRAVELFLDYNGYTHHWDEQEAEAFTLEIAQQQQDVSEIAEWLAARVSVARDSL